MNISTNESLQEGLPISTANHKKRNLTIRFCLAAIIVTSMLVLALTAAAYIQIRDEVLRAHLDEVVEKIDAAVSGPELMGLSGKSAEDPVVVRLRDSILSIPGVQSVTLFNTQLELDDGKRKDRGLL